MIASTILNPLKLSVWTPSVSQIRWTNRPNLQKPLPLHYRRKMLVEVTKPIYPNPPDLCHRDGTRKELSPKEFVEGNPYFRFVAKYNLQRFYDAQMVAIFHMNSFKMSEFLKVRGMLYDADYDLTIEHRVKEQIIYYALSGTKFSPVLPLVTSCSAYGFSNNKDLPGLLKVAKKMPMFTLLAVIMEDQLLNRLEIDKLVEIKTLDTARAQLCQTLSQPLSALSESLESAQKTLVQSLSTYSNPSGESSSSSSSSDSSSESDSEAPKPSSQAPADPSNSETPPSEVPKESDSQPKSNS